MLKAIRRVIIGVLLVGVLSGCYLPADEHIQMSRFTLQVFVVLSNTAHDFEWYKDGELVQDENGNFYRFILPDEIGTLTIEVKYQDLLGSQSHKWYVDVVN